MINKEDKTEEEIKEANIKVEMTDYKYDQLNLIKPQSNIESMHDFCNKADFENFIKKNLIEEELLGIEPQIDGLSLVLLYKNGELVEAKSKGNQNVSEREIFKTIKNIPSIPKFLSSNEDLIVRGTLTIEHNYYEKNLSQFFSSVRMCVRRSLYTKDRQRVLVNKLVFYASAFLSSKFKTNSEHKIFFEKEFLIIPNLEKIDPEIIKCDDKKQIDHVFFSDGIVYKLDSQKNNSPIGGNSNNFHSQSSKSNFDQSEGKNPKELLKTPISRSKIILYALSAVIICYSFCIFLGTMSRLFEMKRQLQRDRAESEQFSWEQSSFRSERSSAGSERSSAGSERSSAWSKVPLGANEVQLGAKRFHWSA